MMVANCVGFLGSGKSGIVLRYTPGKMENDERSEFGSAKVLTPRNAKMLDVH